MTKGAEVHPKNLPKKQQQQQKPLRAKPWHIVRSSKSMAYIHPAITQPAKPPSENIPVVHLAQGLYCTQQIVLLHSEFPPLMHWL